MWLNSHKNLAMAIGIGVAAVFLVLIAILPMYKNASKLLKQIKTKSSELETLTSKVTVLSQLDGNVLKDRVVVLDKALPPKKDILQYLASIDGLSRELGLSFGGLNLAPGEITEASGSGEKKSVKNSGLQSLETELKMKGSEDSVYAFLRKIEEVLPLMQIRDIKVTILPDKQFSLSLTLGMLWAEPATADVKSQVTLFGEAEEKYFAQLSQYRAFDPVVISAVGGTGKADLFTPFKLENVTPASTE